MSMLKTLTVLAGLPLPSLALVGGRMLQRRPDASAPDALTAVTKSLQKVAVFLPYPKLLQQRNRSL